jgi:DNA-binding PadR family transcriptional regulator
MVGSKDRKEANVSVKYGLLGILAKQPQHGYELKRTFEQITGGFWQLNYGQIYQTLDRLEGEGYVTFTVEHEENVPDRKVYEITSEGEKALGDWLANPSPRPRPLRDELFIRLAVMSNGGLGAIFELLASHREIYLEKMAELTKAKTDIPAPSSRTTGAGVPDELIEELLVDAALFHAEADLRWLEHCEAKLRASQRSRVN